MVKEEIINIIKDYISLLDKEGIKYEKVILFGSQLYGNTNEWSDIDLAVVSSDFDSNTFNDRLMLAKLAYIIDPRLEVHPVNLYEYNNESWKTLVHEIKTNGIEVAA